MTIELPWTQSVDAHIRQRPQVVRIGQYRELGREDELGLGGANARYYSVGS